MKLKLLMGMVAATGLAVAGVVALIKELNEDNYSEDIENHNENSEGNIVFDLNKGVVVDETTDTTEEKPQVFDYDKENTEPTEQTKEDEHVDDAEATEDAEAHRTDNIVEDVIETAGYIWNSITAKLSELDSKRMESEEFKEVKEVMHKAVETAQGVASDLNTKAHEACEDEAIKEAREKLSKLKVEGLKSVASVLTSMADMLGKLSEQTPNNDEHEGQVPVNETNTEDTKE